jgi:uncharacterized protein
MAITPDLIAVLRAKFRLDWDGIHGARHWARVRRNGLRLARSTGANPRVVEYFAFLHDSCRYSDDEDPRHGPRAAVFAEGLRAGHIALSDEQFGELRDAIAGHTHGQDHPSITVRTCWDADRLDLTRIGIDPDPELLFTEPAKQAALKHLLQPRVRRRALWSDIRL